MNRAGIAIGLVAFALFAGLFFARLRRAEYPLAACCAVTALLLLQPGLLLSIGSPANGLWFALGVYAVAASVAGFLEREDARGVMQLGGSLALVQILDPLGGLTVAALLPGLFGLNRRGSPIAQSAGLYALVLFIPVMAAIALVYLSREQHFNIPQFILHFYRAPRARIAPVSSMPLRLAADCAPLLIVTPVLLRGFLIGHMWTPQNAAVALMASAIVAAAMTATFLGAIRDPQMLAIAATPLPLIAIAQWPKSKFRNRDAIIMATGTAVLAWSLLL